LSKSFASFSTYLRRSGSGVVTVSIVAIVDPGRVERHDVAERFHAAAVGDQPVPQSGRNPELRGWAE
jgi:hypothetical protein